MRGISPAHFILLLFAAAAQGCFTGVESTPRISYTESKADSKIRSIPERSLLAGIDRQEPAQWQPGKKFYVTDSKISIIFAPQTSDAADNLFGKVITYQGIVPAVSITGDPASDVIFNSPTGQRLSYRVNHSRDTLLARRTLDIPFTVEMSVVDSVSGKIRGGRYYITTPLWYDGIGAQLVDGLRHIPVEVSAVLPGNTMFPLRVVFSPLGDTTLYSVYMSVGNQRTATRNFDTLFSMTDPRKLYPGISDETWNLIVHSRVKDGMTRNECRLALGAPRTSGQRPTKGGMVEYWSYDDGLYLIFEDGYLTTHR